MLRALPPYVFAELDRLKLAARERGQTYVDLGIGSPDIPVAPSIIDALSEAAKNPATHGYPPFRGVPAYLTAIQRYMDARFGVSIEPATEALALSGAKEGLAQVIMSVATAGDVVLVPEIYYPVYARSVWLAGAKVEWIRMRAEDQFALDLDAIPRDVASRAKAIIVNYPNNPTGARADLAFYERAVAFAREHSMLLISDLAYSELVFSGPPAPSALEIDGARDVTIEFHSFSKTYSMAGFRLGFAVGCGAAVDALAAYRTNVGYGTPTSVQYAGAYALDHRATLVPPKLEEYRARRDVMVAAFRDAGWDITPPPASMYLWLSVPEGIDDWAWVNALLADGVVVTPGVAFGDGGAGFFRISLVRDRATLAAAARTIAARRAALLGR